MRQGQENIHVFTLPEMTLHVPPAAALDEDKVHALFGNVQVNELITCPFWEQVLSSSSAAAFQKTCASRSVLNVPKIFNF